MSILLCSIVVIGAAAQRSERLGFMPPGLLSPDALHEVSFVEGETNVLVYGDGHLVGRYAAVIKETLVFSRSSARFAFVAGDGITSSVVVDGKEGPRYSLILKGCPQFSPDSSHVAYGARREKRWRMVVDGKKAPIST